MNTLQVGIIMEKLGRSVIYLITFLVNTSTQLNMLDICFQQIKGDYWLGQYGDFKVVMRKTDGFINTTRLCKDSGKEFCKWSRLEGSKELIAAVTEHCTTTN